MQSKHRVEAGSSKWRGPRLGCPGKYTQAVRRALGELPENGLPIYGDMYQSAQSAGQCYCNKAACVHLTLNSYCKGMAILTLGPLRFSSRYLCHDFSVPKQLGAWEGELMAPRHSAVRHKGAPPSGCWPLVAQVLRANFWCL